MKQIWETNDRRSYKTLRVVPGKWSVSKYAYKPEIRAHWQLPKSITIHDITLRNGEQTPWVVFRREEKLRIARALA